MKDIKDFINWKTVSLHLTGNDNSIRKNRVPKIYQVKVKMLLFLVKKWVKKSTIKD